MDSKIMKKRPSEAGNDANPVEKKAKIYQGRKAEILPDEIWLKIMYFMKSKDILANFGRTCKRFRCLSLDSEVIKYLDLININDKVKYDGSVKVIKRSKNLQRISIGLSLPYWKHLMNHALKKSSFRSLELTDQVLPFKTYGGSVIEKKARFTFQR